MAIEPRKKLTTGHEDMAKIMGVSGKTLYNLNAQGITSRIGKTKIYDVLQTCANYASHLKRVGQQRVGEPGAGDGDALGIDPTAAMIRLNVAKARQQTLLLQSLMEDHKPADDVQKAFEFLVVHFGVGIRWMIEAVLHDHGAGFTKRDIENTKSLYTGLYEELRSSVPSVMRRIRNSAITELSEEDQAA